MHLAFIHVDQDSAMKQNIAELKCVCVCVCVRARARVCVCVCVSECIIVCVYVWARLSGYMHLRVFLLHVYRVTGASLCVCACVSACLCVCVCARVRARMSAWSRVCVCSARARVCKDVYNNNILKNIYIYTHYTHTRTYAIRNNTKYPIWTKERNLHP